MESESRSMSGAKGSLLTHASRVPPTPLIDGFFYEAGVKLAFPFYNPEGSVAARCELDQLPALRAAANKLRTSKSPAFHLELAA